MKRTQLPCAASQETLSRRFHLNDVGLFLSITNFSAPDDHNRRTLNQNNKVAPTDYLNFPDLHHLHYSQHSYLPISHGYAHQALNTQWLFWYKVLKSFLNFSQKNMLKSVTPTLYYTENNFCLCQGSIVMMKNHDQRKQVGEGKGLFGLYFNIVVQHWRESQELKQGRNQEAGADAQAYSLWLAQPAFS